MKKLPILGLTLSLFFISITAFSYDYYDYSPADGSEYSDYHNNWDSDEYRPHYRKYSKSPRYTSGHFASNSSGKLFIFDPGALRWFAYYNGSLVNSGPASGGRHYCPDIRRGCKTPVGSFRITSKGGPDCRSSKYPVGRGNAPMPWCMFFHRGYAIHGGPVRPYNASHGCIRVLPPHARWLSQNFLSPGTKVIVRPYR